MQLLGADADLRPQAKLKAIRKAGGGIDIYRSRVHLLQKGLRIGIILGDDAFAVAGGIALDMGYRLIQTVNDANGQDQIQKLRGIIFFTGRQSIRYPFARPLTAANFNALFFQFLGTAG